MINCLNLIDKTTLPRLFVFFYKSVLGDKKCYKNIRISYCMMFYFRVLCGAYSSFVELLQ